jgi:hypothetical protein
LNAAVWAKAADADKKRATSSVYAFILTVYARMGGVKIQFSITIL